MLILQYGSDVDPLTTPINGSGYAAPRAAILATCRRMAAAGLVVNTSGNVSARVGADIVVTPNAIPYDELREEMLAVVDLESGVQVGSGLLPTSEIPLHLEVYRATDALAIVHTHSPYATALSIVATELPAIHYQIADLGGPVPVLPYERFGSAELAATVAAGLTDRTAVLMANHGATVVGPDLDRALARAVTLEWLCRVYQTASTMGSPAVLSADELEGVLAKQRDLRDRRLARRRELEAQ